MTKVPKTSEIVDVGTTSDIPGGNANQFRHQFFQLMDNMASLDRYMMESGWSEEILQYVIHESFLKEPGDSCPDSEGVEFLRKQTLPVNGISSEYLL